MDYWAFPDGNITAILESGRINSLQDVNQRLQIHSSLIQRLALEKEMEGHQGCVNALAWNSRGSLLISGSDDTRINIWNYSNQDLLHCIETGHSSNIFCTKFVPETNDELLVSGAGDAEVRVFNLSCLSGRSGESSPEPSAVFQCHSKRVKKLAVEVGNPNLVWSASEDGTLRQHDFREVSSCPSAGSSNRECRNVLLDLRCGAKKSLADYPRQCLALKSCDINSTRPHQILVGGSDAFARLYDRRMLPPLSSCQIMGNPPACVSYFCPMHLSERRRSGLHLTHVTFSPNGEEVLLSYSGEHVYLMDVNVGDRNVVRYSADDVPKLMYFAPISKETEMHSPRPVVSSNHFNESKNVLAKVDMHKKLLKAAAKCLEEGSNIHYGIEACDEVLDGKSSQIDLTLKHNCLCIRAALLLKRKWKNDSYMATRDCNQAHSIDAFSFRAHYYMSEALMQLGKHKKALDYAIAALYLAPSSSEAAERVRNLKDHLAAAEAEKNRKDSEGTTKAEIRPHRVRTLSDVLFRSEWSNEASQEGHRDEREDSDYEEEMELDFETSISGDEGHDIESRILRGSLNLRFHRKDDLHKENCSDNGSCGSSSSSSQAENHTNQPEVAVDLKQRYIGHCNIGTDIKQASFLGQLGDFVASGSDDGRWFIWEKRTGRLVKMLAGDEAVVNCVQCHPFDCAVATSGIDNTIKMWTPHAEIPSMVAGGAAGPETANVLGVIENNQQKLCRNREGFLPIEFLERFRMHEFAEGSFHPFECAQS